MDKVSVIIPCYNEQETIPLFYQEITNVLKNTGYEYELLFVDDGSADKTLMILKNLAQEDCRVIYISFSRNFGKEAAMYAGFCNVRGDYIVVMDADMQDPPHLLPEMIKIIHNGQYDSVATRRVSRRGEPPIRSWLSRKFYKIINCISNVDIVEGARDYRLMKRKMVDAIVSLKEYNRFSKGIFGWVGFSTYWLSYENTERIAGETKWNLWRLFKYAVDGIISFSHIPLSIASWLGIMMTFFSFVVLIVIIAKKLLWGDPVMGWPSLVCIIIFCSGVQLFCIGIMGQYVAKIYIETKQRPHFVISEKNI